MAAILKELVDAGLQGAKLVAAFERIEAAAPKPTDETAERRRAWDRQRKAAKRVPNSTGIPPESAETGGIPPEQSEASRTRSISSSLPSEVKDKSSEASASGGEPPNSYPADPVERLWAEGIDAMRAMGSADRDARSNIGRWLRDAKGDAVLVLGAIIQARAKGTRDPVALVSRILKPVQSNGTSEDKSVHRAARGLVERVQGFIDDAEPAAAFSGQQSGGTALRLLPERRG